MLDEGSVVYRGVAPGTDLRYRVLPTGVKEELVLASPEAPRSFRFHIADPHGQLGEAEATGDGGYRFQGRIDGEVAVGLAAPYAYEQSAAGQLGAGGAAAPEAHDPSSAGMSVTKAGDGVDVTVAVEEAWLAGKRFPVVLDPTVTFTKDTGMFAGQIANHPRSCGGGCTVVSTSDLAAGTYTGANYEIQPARSVFKFDLSSIPAGSTVSSANLGLYTSNCVGDPSDAGDNYHCDEHSYTVTLNQLGGPWNGASTWDQLAAITSTMPFAQTFTGPFSVYSPCVGCFWMDFPVTGKVQEWVNGTVANNGFVAKLSSEPPNIGGPFWSYLGSRGAAVGNLPYLQVVYSSDQQPIAGGPLSGSHVFGGGNGFNPYCDDCTTRNSEADPVDTASGNFWESFTDVAIPGRGTGLGVSRTYNAQAAGSDGLFGFGWSWTYGAALSVTAREAGTNRPLAVTVSQESGATASFSRPDSSVAFSAPPWVKGSLTHEPVADSYTVKRRGSETLSFDGSGRLTGITDANGYMTSLGWSATQLVVTEPAPGLRKLIFSLAVDAAGRNRVTRVTDPAGRVVSYRYDPSGNLTDVFDVNGPVPPPIGPYTATTGHTVLGYQTPSNHLLTSLVSPRFANDTSTVPAPVLRNVYDAASPPRVIEQYDELGHKTTFNYTGDPAFPGSVIVTHPDNNNPAGTIRTLDQYQYGVLVTHITGYGTAGSSTWRYLHDPTSLGVSRAVAPDGAVRVARFDGRGNQVWALDPLGRSTEAGFNAFDQPLWTKDAKRTVTTYTYDQANNGPNLVSVTTPLNATETATATLVYGERGNTNPGEATSMVDPQQQQALFRVPWKYDYDLYGLRTAVTDPLGHRTSQAFDVVGRRTSTKNGRGKTTTYEFAADGLVTKVTDPLGHFTTQAYDADRNPVSSTDAKQNQTTIEVDAAGRATRVIRPPATPSSAPTFAYSAYWPDGSLKEQRDHLGAVTGYAYDTQGRLSSVTDPAGRVTAYGYDQVGNPTTKTQPGGQCTTPKSGCTTMTYDAAGQMLTTSYSDLPADNVTIPAYPVGYDANGLRQKMTDKTGTSTWNYDLGGRLTSHTDGAGATVGYTWDRKSQLTGIAYPAGLGTVTRSFDAGGRLYGITDWLGNTTTLGYDDNNNIVTQSSPIGLGAVVDTTSRNDADEVTSISIDKGAGFGLFPSKLASFAYGRDNNGQVGSVASTGMADTHTYGYTGLNQLNTQDAGSYSYDPADNLTGTRTGTKQTFDVANQLCWTDATTDPAASCTANIPTGATRYSYDNRGNRTSKTPYGGPASSYGYDQADRMTSATGPPPGTQPQYPQVGDFDGNGTKDRAVFHGGNWHIEGQATLTYGTQGDLPVAADYDGDGKTDLAVFRPSTGTWYVKGGLTTQWGTNGDIPVPGDYDGDGKADLAVFRPSTGTWYLYFQGGQGTQWGTNGDIPAPGDYDGDGKTDLAVFRPSTGTWFVKGGLTTQWGTTGDIPVPADLNGDGKTDVAVYRPSTGTWFVKDQFSIVYGTQPGDIPVPADYNGDKTADLAVYRHPTTTWHTQNRPTITLGPTINLTTTNYTYNGDGLRTAKTAAGTTTTNFTWDQAQGLPLLLKDGNDAYIYGPDGQPISKISSGTITWIHHDQLGSTRLLTDNTGTTTGTYTYDPYGNTTTHTGTATTNLQYAGQYTDPETGLQYLRARYYDPETAQFLTRDPLRSITRSPYGYVDGDPLNVVDPSGLWGLKNAMRFVNDHAAEIALVTAVVVAVAVVTVATGGVGGVVLAGGFETMAMGGMGSMGLSMMAGSAAGLGVYAMASSINGDYDCPTPQSIPGNPWRGPNAPEQAYEHLEDVSQLNPHTASNRLHKIKHAAGLRPDDDVAIGKTGDVYDEQTGQKIGSLTDPGWGG